jgi:predicted N-formylglutamate amidohydrolase
MVLRPEIWYLLYGNHAFSDQQIRERLSEILQPYRERHQQPGEDEA